MSDTPKKKKKKKKRNVSVRIGSLFITAENIQRENMEKFRNEFRKKIVEQAERIVEELSKKYG